MNASGVAQWAVNGDSLCTATNIQANPTIVTDGTGGAIVAWQDRRSGTFDIYARRIDSTGSRQWAPNGVALCTAAGHQELPVAASDGAGGVAIAWVDHRNGTGDIFGVGVDAMGMPEETSNGDSLCTAAGDQSWPAIAPNGMGVEVVAWADARAGNGQDDIYAQRLDVGPVVGVPETPTAALTLRNAPNPFSESTRFEIHPASDGNLTIQVYDVNGRRVRRQVLSVGAGVHSIHYDGRDDWNRPLKSGTYIYCVIMKGMTAKGKMTITR